jgi:hypothetical protein
MADNPTKPARTPSRKPQINFEVTKEEKEFFEQLAEARGMKLAALVRELLNSEGQRLGIPAMLEEYRTQDARYQFIVGADVKSETKVGIFRQFLLAFKSDCDFSINSFDVDHYIPSVQCTAYSSSGESSNTIYISLSRDKVINHSEREAIHRSWNDVLGLSLNLKDKWNGVNYTVEKMRTLRGKQILLKQFVENYRDYKFDFNDSYGGGTTFKVTANNQFDKKELLIDYLPKRAGEAIELRRALEEYQQNLKQ